MPNFFFPLAQYASSPSTLPNLNQTVFTYNGTTVPLSNLPGYINQLGPSFSTLLSAAATVGLGGELPVSSSTGGFGGNGGSTSVLTVAQSGPAPKIAGNTIHTAASFSVTHNGVAVETVSQILAGLNYAAGALASVAAPRTLTIFYQPEPTASNTYTVTVLA